MRAKAERLNTVETQIRQMNIKVTIKNSEKMTYDSISFSEHKAGKHAGCIVYFRVLCSL